MISVISNETRNELIIFAMSKCNHILVTRNNFFISSSEKNENMQKLKVKLFE